MPPAHTASTKGVEKSQDVSQPIHDKNDDSSQRTRITRPLPEGRLKKVKVYPELAKRIRAKRPKTRTGCVTCKIRRVKCGEELPSCLRCSIFGVVCDGYKKPVSNNTMPILLPKTHSSPMQIMPEDVMFSNQLEHQYFQFFQEDVVIDLSCHIPGNLWTMVVLPASASEPALRYLSIAVSALRRSQVDSNSPGSLSHYHFAFSQYDRALKRLQVMMKTCHQEEAIRRSLIASILIYCFENALGQRPQAAAHLLSALGLMRRLSRKKKQSKEGKNSSAVADVEFDLTEAYIPLLNTVTARLRGRGLDTVKSPRQINASRSMQLQMSLEDCVMLERCYSYLEFRATPVFIDMSFGPSNLLKNACPSNLIFQGKYTDHMTAVVIKHRFVANVTAMMTACNDDDSSDQELVELSQQLLEVNANILEGKPYDKSVNCCDIIPALFVVLIICPRRDIKDEALRLLGCAASRIGKAWDVETMMKMDVVYLILGN